MTTIQTTNSPSLPRNQLPRGRRPSVGVSVTSMVTVRFGKRKDLLDRLKAHALKQDITLNQIIIDILDEAIPK